MTKTLVVTAKKPFRILSVHCADDCFEFQTANVEKAVHVIPVTFKATEHPGEIEQAIAIDTDLNGGLQVKCTATATVRAS